MCLFLSSVFDLIEFSLSCRESVVFVRWCGGVYIRCGVWVLSVEFCVFAMLVLWFWRVEGRIILPSLQEFCAFFVFYCPVLL